MNTHYSRHAAAFTLALITTIAILSGVHGLTAPANGGALLVQAHGNTAQG